MRVTRTGLVLRLALRPGQDAFDVAASCDRLRHSFGMYGVTSRELRSGVVELRMTGYDVLQRVQMPARTDVRPMQVPVALREDWPEPRKKLPPRASALDPYKPVTDEILRTDLDAPRKQRHTVTRIFHRLVEEHGADVSYGMVRYYVAARKPEILTESGRAPLEAFVPQTHQPGHEAEVDFGDVTVRLAGELVTCYLFSLRLSYSGKAVHRVFASCGQEALFEGHVHALRTLGGVPRTRCATTTSRPPSPGYWD